MLKLTEQIRDNEYLNNCLLVTVEIYVLRTKIEKFADFG